MNEDRWTIEFMLRSSINDHSLKRNLQVISIPNSDFRLKKSIILRAIQMEREEAAVTDTLLVLFELIEQLDANEGLAMMDSMKAAYCAVALECTVKYLAAGDNRRYADVVRRIWRGRLAALERSGRSRLVSMELDQWKGEVEAALLDKSVEKRLVDLNTRNEALKMIGDYLSETWGILGLSFTELHVLLMENGMIDDMHSVKFERAIDRLYIVSVDVGGGKIVLPSQKENYWRLVCQGRVPVPHQVEAKRHDWLNVNGESDVNDSSKRPIFVAMNTRRVQDLATETMEAQESVEEEVEVLNDPSSSSRDTDMHIHCGFVNGDVGKSGSGKIELLSQVKSYSRPERRGSVPVLSQAEAMINDWLNMVRDSGGNDGSKQPNFVAVNTERVQESAIETVEGQESVEVEVAVSHDPSPSGRENLKTSALPQRVRGAAKISHLDDLEDDSLSGKYTCLRTPEVERVREALRTSSLELQTLVKDPFPNALRTTESVAEDLSEKNKTSEHYVEDPNDVGAANSPINKDDVPVQSVNTDPKNPSHDHHTTDPRPSIMKGNSTTCTNKRNDSIDGSSGENLVDRLSSPSSKRKVISPLKKYEGTKMVCRRKCRRWSLLEEDTLRTAVQRFGKGNWKLILQSYRDIFDERTEVDLKDKWRNMTR